MLHMVFAVYDSASAVYDRPWVARSEGEAVRSFGDIACDADHPIGKHPEHYKLYRLGTYDDNTGLLDPGDKGPVHVANAHELVAQARNIPAGSLKGNGSLANMVDDVDDVAVSYGGSE
jgi:hypothetical protein